MKKIILCLAAITLSLMTAVAAKQPVRILAIGNSFSEDAVESNLWDIAKSDGRTFIIGNMYIGGCSLEKHWKNADGDNALYSYRKIDKKGVKTRRDSTSLSFALADEPWDIITFQQSSPLSGIQASYEPFIGNLVDYVRGAVGKEVKLMFFQTWSYSMNATRQGFNKYGFSQSKMYYAIVDASRAVCEKYSFGVIPVGTAIQNMRKSELQDNETRDGSHLNIVGKYAAACTWYEAITGRSVPENKFVPANVEPWMVEVARIAAHKAVESPYKPFGEHIGEPRHKTNLDEAKAGEYTLPDPLVMKNGKKVQSAEQWFNERRPELLEMFRTEMFGRSPQKPKNLKCEVIETAKDAFGGLATRKQVRIQFTSNPKDAIYLLMYIPNEAQGPVPMFLGPNFKSNVGTNIDPDIILPPVERYGVLDSRERGIQDRRWPYEMILNAGYGIATYFRGDIDPDYYSGFSRAPYKSFYEKDQTYPKPDEWGAIAAWAWGDSRVMDYLETDPDVDSKRVAVIGHSRLGKAALWAGAQDERFALVISSCSGEGGAAIARRDIGETILDLNQHFPHWFCLNYRKYNNHPELLPFDQHELVALIAPRPVYIGSATLDIWADPKGEFISAQEGSKVYRFLGLEGIPEDAQWPSAMHPVVGDYVGYHMREGKHDITPYDWQQYIRFADKHLKK